METTMATRFFYSPVSPAFSLGIQKGNPVPSGPPTTQVRDRLEGWNVGPSEASGHQGKTSTQTTPLPHEWKML